MATSTASTTSRLIAAVSAVLIAAIGIFAGIHYTGGSENNCSGAALCGDGNKGNTIAPKIQATR
jgi:hypothetical protein